MRKVLICIVIIVVFGALAACASDAPRIDPSHRAANLATNSATDEAECQPYPGVTLVVGAHEDSELPSLPLDVECKLAKTVEAGLPIGLVVVDGKPRVVQAPMVFEVDDTNATVASDSREAAMSQIVTAVSAAAPDSDGADLLAGLRLAADISAASTIPIGVLVVVDNGVSDTGDVDMTAAGMSMTTGKGLATHLLNDGDIRSDSFAGLQVDFYGLGYVTAPAAALSEIQRSRIGGAWVSIVEAGGGAATSIRLPRLGAGPVSSFTTRDAPVVDLDDGWSPVAGDIVKFDQSDLEFEGDETWLLDEKSAKGIAGPIAEWLSADGGRTIVVAGRTSSANPNNDENLILGKGRALTFARLIVACGGSKSQITTIGLGYTADPPDRDADGNLIDSAARANRVVQVEFIG